MKSTQELRDYVRQLPKTELLSRARKLVSEERKIQAEFLVYLERIDSLKVHLEYSYGSLHEFLVKDFKFSEGAAQRRIQSYYLMKAVPETKAAIEEGRLSLSAAYDLQTFFNAEARAKGKEVEPEKKQELFKTVQGMSKRETQQHLAGISPVAALPRENVKALTADKSQLTAVLDTSVIRELDRLRELLAHHRIGNKSGGPAPKTYGEIIAVIARMALERVDPVRKLEKREKAKGTERRIEMETSPSTSTPPAVNQCVKKSVENSRYIPAELKRQVHKRDASQCTWMSNDKRCESRLALEIDHVIAFALGGKTVLSNLRLLCRAHHRLRTLQVFGFAKIERYQRKIHLNHRL